MLKNFIEILVGNQIDEHGCTLDGGYKWCDSLKKCIRPWDTSCPVKMCKDSEMQLCRMMCSHKECGKDECVKRIGSCCDFECVGLGSSDKLNVVPVFLVLTVSSTCVPASIASQALVPKALCQSPVVSVSKILRPLSLSSK